MSTRYCCVPPSIKFDLSPIRRPRPYDDCGSLRIYDKWGMTSPYDPFERPRPYDPFERTDQWW